MTKEINLPLTEEIIKDLKAGDSLSLSGVLYVARDAAQQRIVAALGKGETLPLEIKGQTIYYI